MSENSKQKKIKIPGFELNPETKKYVPVPFKYDDHYYAFFGERNPGSKAQSSQYTANSASRKTAFQTYSSYKKNSSVKPPAADRGSPAINKNCKSMTGPRKALFKVPMESNNISKQSQLAKPLVTTTSVETLPFKISTTRAPLTSMKAVCELQAPISETTKNIQTSPKCTVTSPSKQLVKLPETPISCHGSLSEFLAFEQQCRSVKKPSQNAGSQISVICTSLDNNTLQKAIEKSASATSILDEIRQLIKAEQSRLDANLQKFLEENRTSNQNLEHLNILVNQLEQQLGDQNDCNKENTACITSQTLSNKNSTFTVKEVPHGDMLKNTLAKNFYARCQTDQVRDTRAKNAEDLYIETKNSCSILLTPARPLQEAVSNSPSSAVRFLSLRIQEQCLMLQDTPAHK